MRHSKPTATYIDDAKGVMLVRVRRGKTVAESLKLHDGSLGFCELCWRQTEYAERQLKRYLRKANGAVEEVTEIFPSDRTARDASKLLEAFLQGLREAYTESSGTSASDGADSGAAKFSLPQIIMLIGIGKFTRLREKFAHVCELPYGQITAGDIERNAELRGELLALIEDGVVASEQKHANLIENPTDRPSDRFCSSHNQYRSDEAKRLYKRDHAKRDEFAAKIASLKSYGLQEELKVVRNNDLDAIRDLRKEAYLAIHPTPLKPKASRKSAKHGETIQRIDSLIASGFTNLSEIANLIGVSRAAVSIALKRKAKAS
jgi:hypothetical protein